MLYTVKAIFGGFWALKYLSTHDQKKFEKSGKNNSVWYQSQLGAHKVSQGAILKINGQVLFKNKIPVLNKCLVVALDEIKVQSEGHTNYTAFD